MKKILSAIIVLALCVSTAMPAFAYYGITSFGSIWNIADDGTYNNGTQNIHIPQTGANNAIQEAENTGPQVTVLMYHKLSDNSEEWSDFCISPAMFENDIIKLKNLGYTFLKPQELKDITAEGKYVLLTFDDGYESDYKLALPILEKHKVPATFFIIGSYIGTAEYMTKEQIKSLSDSNYAVIGSHSAYLHTLPHTVVSRNLEFQDFKDYMVNDFLTSFSMLEGITSKPVTCFSYPNGLYTEDIDARIKEAKAEAVSFSSDLKTVSLPLGVKNIAGRYNRYFDFDVTKIK